VRDHAGSGSMRRIRTGMVMIVVVVIVMMVSLAAYHFTLSMELEHLATASAGERIAAYQAARSGVELAAALLEQPRAARPPSEAFENQPIPLWPDESQSGVSFEVVFSDEAAKLNLRQLLEWELDSPGLAHDALMRLPEMDSATADRLLDWIDPDSDMRPQGNESEARNSIPLTIDELAFLHFGDSGDSATTEHESNHHPAWIEYLTIHSAERNESSDGEPRIFINSDDLADLYALLNEALPQSMADYIIWYRQYGPARNRSSEAVPLAADANAAVNFAHPARFEIGNVALLLDSAVMVPVADESDVSSRQRIASPFRLQGGSGLALPIDEVFDRLTVTSLERFAGRISVMTASAEVLAAIPGLDESVAERIVESRAAADQSFRHPIGLLSSLAIDSTMVKRILPYLTIGSDVARVTVAIDSDPSPAAISRRDRTRYRYEAILDASHGSARQLLFRNLPQPPLALSDSPDTTSTPRLIEREAPFGP